MKVGVAWGGAYAFDLGGVQLRYSEAQCRGFAGKGVVPFLQVVEQGILLKQRVAIVAFPPEPLPVFDPIMAEAKRFQCDGRVVKEITVACGKSVLKDPNRHDVFPALFVIEVDEIPVVWRIREKHIPLNPHVLVPIFFSDQPGNPTNGVAASPELKLCVRSAIAPVIQNIVLIGDTSPAEFYRLHSGGESVDDIPPHGNIRIDVVVEIDRLAGSSLRMVQEANIMNAIVLDRYASAQHVHVDTGGHILEFEGDMIDLIVVDSALVCSPEADSGSSATTDLVVSDID